MLGACIRHMQCAVGTEMNGEFQGPQTCMEKAEKGSLIVVLGETGIPRGRDPSVWAGKCPGEGGI